jgi:hypothetical protein
MRVRTPEWWQSRGHRESTTTSCKALQDKRLRPVMRVTNGFAATRSGSADSFRCTRSPGRDGLAQHLTAPADATRAVDSPGIDRARVFAFGALHHNSLNSVRHDVVGEMPNQSAHQAEVGEVL